MDTTPIHHPRSVRITKSVLKACSCSAACRLDQAGMHLPESPSLYVSNQGRYKRYFCASFRGHNYNSNYPIVFTLGSPGRVTRSFCHSYTEVRNLLIHCLGEGQKLGLQLFCLLLNPSAASPTPGQV